MKTSLAACSVLFLSCSIVASTESDDLSYEVHDPSGPVDVPEFSACEDHDKKSGRAADDDSITRLLTAAANPLESAFLKLSCLLTPDRPA